MIRTAPLGKSLVSLAAASAIAIAGTAHAAAAPTPTPKPNPSTPSSQLGHPSGTSPTVVGSGVIAVGDLPLAQTAKYKPIYGHAYTASVLYGISACSPGGRPVADRLDPRSTAGSQAYIAPLTASGDTRGWSAFLSAATYPSVDAASYALNAYRSYLDNCPLADTKDLEHNGAAGTSALDPTTAHAIISTKDRWIEVFAVATHRGIVEVVYTKPKGAPVDFGYNPAATFSALKAADITTFTQQRTTTPSR